MRLGRLTIVALAVTVAGLAPACGSDDDTDPVGDESTSTTGSADSPQDVANTVQMRDFAFAPNELQVPSGATTLKVQNAGSARHTFTMDEPSTDQEVSAGSNADVSLDLPEPGEYVFYCRFHRGSGMEGKLVVS